MQDEVFKANLIQNLRKVHLQIGHLSASLYISPYNSQISDEIAMLNIIKSYIEKVASKIDRKTFESPDTDLVVADKS